MTNLSKLDKTVDQLEKQAEILKHNNNVLSRVNELAGSITQGVDELSHGNKNFNEIKNNIHSSLQSLNISVSQLEKINEKHIDDLVLTNKKNIREFEDTVSSKLERFISDIQVTIRQERTALQESLQNNISIQFSNMESKQLEMFHTQHQQINSLKKLLIAAILVSIGLGVAIFLK